MKHLKLLPVLVLVALLSFVVRLGDMWVEVRTPQQVITASTMAETKPADAPVSDVDVPEGLPEDEPAPLPADDWADPETIDMQFSETQRTILDELKERRGALDSRENRIQQREALLKVTEQRIEEKISELDSIRVEIKDLLGEQSEEEEARLQSLVKIYSGMKPKEAAAIFDNLNMDILLQVMARMSERKSAPIMAAMNVQKAQELTLLLAEQRQLPEFIQ